MTFEEYTNQIHKFAEDFGAIDSTGKYCEPEAWLEMYEEGLTPLEAWQIELEAMADMV